ncbi:S-formylglutathione hydrol [Coccomyxa subellipsoidea C-169]|uniref:S-formylglutathione hydrolase n=1 Tax=Coccomyxa subellipsoidea (strain C-169) TaxID=574566 RepID=I0Z9G5_COCSC|nr:S-formylglutathione hydrol [Coccomyxa subellipsoidea C-169]EIE27284.1 S-formylglutathione hydrol [Coccomyxa subellipsoidea C-169]|eukprot:XP_005651828.1 S-formylglutathione hydrol [Coccomyxa subellipsoidea C-169]
MAELQKSNKVFGGWNRRYAHKSEELGCTMNFSVFFPPAAESQKVPVVYFLSGLTCTDENVMTKSGIQRKAAEEGVAIIAPDTSPRGLNIPGESDSWDFGVGAGFYLNATQPTWKNWRMYDYITKELPSVLEKFEELDLSNAAIMGHSMGGHGALTLGLRNPQLYKSISAFSPICNPTQVPWGQKAFSGYLGDNQEEWKQYDATELVKAYNGPPRSILIDVGTKDDFLEKQLKPESFAKAAASQGGSSIKLQLRMQEDYDHSYFFISTFVADHLAHHANALKATS